MHPMDILSELNEKQREAAECTEGPLLILAGAGSGKTKTLTHRVAHLIRDKRVPAGSIMAVTFTNKAAGEMRERIASMLRLPQVPQGGFFHPNIPVIGTFHSICAKILRRDIGVLGRDTGFHIVDTGEQLTIAKRAVKSLGLDPKQFSPKSFLFTISSAKNRMLDAAGFAQSANGYMEEIAAKVFELYEKQLIENEALDFDDLLVMTVKMFREYPGILEKYQRQFRYILVDEYQDTNRVQYEFVAMLAAKHRNLCVVGDDWQSIYAFRGADIRNILEFEKDYPDAKVVHLEQNYRSTQTILDAAHGIISKNTNRKDKRLWTDSDSGEKILVFEAYDERDEARFVSDAIEALSKGDVPFHSCAVLYRTNAQSRAVEESFLDADIPYRIVGGLKFYDRKEIKDMVAYAAFLANFTNRMALSRIVNIPKRGIGEKTFAAWLAYADKEGKDVIEAGEDLPEGVVAPQKRQAIHVFSQWARTMREAMEGATIAEWMRLVYEKSGYEAMLMASKSAEDEARRENVGELLGALKRYNGADMADALNLFLEEAALASEADETKETEDAVHCMTLHAAKGLEFDYVFIVGAEENILPHSRSALSLADLEEERRLMYVGVTRAKKRVHLLYAQSRMLFGSVQANPPSRFLEEIPEDLLERRESGEDGDDREPVFSFERKRERSRNVQPYSARKRSNTSDTATAGEKKAFSDGDRVEHTSFGHGIIVSQNDDTYTIVFQSAGIKKIAKDADVWK